MRWKIKREPNKPINILIFEPYPFNSEGGNQRTLRYILELLNKSLFKITLLSPIESDFIKKLRGIGVDCVVLRPSERLLQYGGNALRDNVFSRLLTIVDIIKYNIRLSALLKKKNIHIIYSNCVRSVLTVGMAAKFTKTAHFVYIKGNLENYFLDPIVFFLADKITFFCESNKNDKYPILVKFFNKKIEILKIGIDPNLISKIENKDKAGLYKELSIDSKNINIIYLGQLYALKGVKYLIEALVNIVKKFPNVKLHIVGDHVIKEYMSYKQELIEIINQNNLQDNVVFTGWRKDALEIVSLMDLLVHPSTQEGFGRAVLEAMALGKPVVASRVGGLREAVRNGQNGFLVEPRDSKAIAEKVCLLLSDKRRMEKFGNAAKEIVFNEYLIKDKILQLEDIWHGMVSPKEVSYQE